MTREALACWWFPFAAGGGIASFVTAACCGRLRWFQTWLDSPVVTRHDYPSPPHHVRLVPDEDR